MQSLGHPIAHYSGKLGQILRTPRCELQVDLVIALRLPGKMLVRLLRVGLDLDLWLCCGCLRYRQQLVRERRMVRTRLRKNS